MKIVAILQARMSSSRLPGKVLEPILGRPMLERQIERLQRAQEPGRLVVATSGREDDDAIAELCVTLDIDCFRGSLDDVLDRYYQAARRFGANHVVRLTADCPLADPEIIDAAVRMHLGGAFDYTSNVRKPTWPDGLDVEVVRFNALADAWREASCPADREHVTRFIRNHPEKYSQGDLTGAPDLSALRWTVDEPEDLELVRCIYQALYPGNPAFTTGDILSLLEREPGLAEINAGVGTTTHNRTEARPDE